MRGSVLVVGGAGYVGAHACRALAHAGYQPVVFDNLSTGHADFVRWGPLIEADIRDAETVAATIRTHNIQNVMHFAACAYVRESVVDPAKYYDNNVAGTLSLLAGMRAAGCASLVFSSTCAVYGQPDAATITETTPTAPVNPYGASKRMAERVLEDFGPAYGTRSFRLRYFNACGAADDLTAGELRDPETHLIPRALMALTGHVTDFEVFGSDFDTPDGTAIRDYVHVDDLADAHVAAIGALRDGHFGGVFNLGTGMGSSVKHVLDTVQTVTGRSLPAVAGARQAGEPARLVADAGAAEQVLGFRPRRSDLRTIVSTAWAWHQRAHPPGETARVPAPRREPLRAADLARASAGRSPQAAGRRETRVAGA